MHRTLIDILCARRFGRGRLVPWRLAALEDGWLHCNVREFPDPLPCASLLSFWLGIRASLILATPLGARLVEESGVVD